MDWNATSRNLKIQASKAPDNTMAAGEDFPSSVEEAGALLGAAITRCGKETFPRQSPPKGMHSSFSTTLPVPSSEIHARLYDLRALLRSSPDQTPLSAAPSLLAVLMKLLGVSTAIATPVGATTPTSSSSSTDQVKLETPPMWSTPLRRLWVDCVVLCHTRGKGLTGTTKIDTVQFVRKMLAIASFNPRSQKAGGGVRIAALCAATALLEQDVLAQQLAPWTLDILQVTSKGLRSAGHGEPTYRVAAVAMACAAATACRHARQSTRSLLLEGAMEDKAIVEVVRVIVKQAAVDKFSEVREQATVLAALVTPMVILQVGETTCLDELIQIAMRNIDDESPHVSDGWANVLAKSLVTAIAHQQSKGRSDSDAQETGGGDSGPRPRSGSGDHMDIITGGRFGTRKLATFSHSMTSVKKAVAFLVDQFVKVGGELSASRAGGSFSVGGRAVRVGYSLALIKFLRLQMSLGAIGDGRDMNVHEVLEAILGMVGQETDKQLRPPASGENLGSPGVAGPLFGPGRTWSKSDSVLVRVNVNRVIRRGLSEVASEQTQLAMLQDLIQFLAACDVSIPTGETVDDSKAGGSGTALQSLNAYQIQVVLVEISHLIATLGEAIFSKIDELVKELTKCLSHIDQGVRLESSVACASLSNVAPSTGRKLLWDLLERLQEHHAQIVTEATSLSGASPSSQQGRGFFRRNRKIADPTIPHQCAIHGIGLMTAMTLRDLPRLDGGLPQKLLETAASAAEVLVSCRNNKTLCDSSPASSCYCVRAGFGILSGILATGPVGTSSFSTLLFRLWRKICDEAKNPTAKSPFEVRHDLFCLDAMLTSIVVFLKNDSELLLVVPEALSEVTGVLEECLAFFEPNGSLSGISLTPPVLARLESAKASLLEAFAWLPSGSFPMAADGVFSLSALHIRQAVENEITCSILQSLVSKEDSLLDARTLSRARRDGQVGGASDLEETIICLTAEVALYRERESIILLQAEEFYDVIGEKSARYRESLLFGHAVASETKKPPTPLHEVGTWRTPCASSCTSKVRLVDAAVQAFAASFGLRSGKEQQDAMEMLESLVPPLLSQLARTLGISTSLNDQDRRSKAKEDFAAVANITAVLLSCLQALPLHEATHNVPIGLGPPWMNKAKGLFLTVLPSPSSIVRRAAAEGLALLATVGVSEDAHFLQSTVLHSLDELMQGNKPDGKPRALALEPVSAARAGSLLTLAYIQRTTYRVAQRRMVRARLRSSSEKAKEARTDESSLPIFQMMTRILPSAGCRGFRDYFTVRTYALHAYTVLLAYSGRLDDENVSLETVQALRKGVEQIEENFVSFWTASSADLDRGQETEKMSTEVSFLCVLIRSMSIFLPYVQHLEPEGQGIARRFCTMVKVILDCHDSHPTVVCEAMVFYEIALSRHEQLLLTPTNRVITSENPVLSCLPSILLTLTPDRPSPYNNRKETVRSIPAIRTAAFVCRLFSRNAQGSVDFVGMEIPAMLIASLESVSGSRRFHYADMTRSLAATRGIDQLLDEHVGLEIELVTTLTHLIGVAETEESTHVRWLLFMRALVSGGSLTNWDEPTGYTRADVTKKALVVSYQDAELVTAFVGPVRWQVKCLAMQLATIAISSLRTSTLDVHNDLAQSTQFDLIRADKDCINRCRKASETGKGVPETRLVLHIEDLLGTACMLSISTLDQSELHVLQGAAMRFLEEIIKCFGGSMDPEDLSYSLLGQYSTQIFSSIKHAMNAPDSSDSQSARRLFVAGCSATQAAVKNGVAVEFAVLKRILRPAIPAAEQVHVFDFGTDPPGLRSNEMEDREISDSRSSYLPLIARLWTCGEVLFKKAQPDSVMIDDVRDALIDDKLAVAITMGAAAIDGLRLSYEKDDVPHSNENNDNSEIGYLFDNPGSIDETTRFLVSMTWSSMASSAVEQLLRCFDESAEDQCSTCSSWIVAIIPLLLEGVRESLDKSVHSKSSQTNRILADCLRGLTQLTLVRNPLSFLDISDDLDDLVELIHQRIIEPVLEQETENNDSRYKHPSDVVEEACALLSGMAEAQINLFQKDRSLLRSLLSPLAMLQNGTPRFLGASASQESILIASLRGMSSLIGNGEANAKVVDALLEFSYSKLATKNGESGISPCLVPGITELLISCLSSPTTSAEKRCQVLQNLAEQDEWTIWSTLIPRLDIGLIGESLNILHEKLRDDEHMISQLAALSATRTVLQHTEIPGTLAGTVFFSVGSDILDLFCRCGSNQSVHEGKDIQTACTDCMKLLLFTHQMIVAEESTEIMIGFLQMFFRALLSVVRVNGLPNHPTAGGDPSLGRMCAQAALHCARSSPEAFKTCMASMSEHDRGLVEFSIRAEMSGYAAAPVEPTKKKLSLKGFAK